MTDNPLATNTVMITDRVLSNAVEVSAGFGHSLAVRSDGTVAGWGGNDLGIALGYKTPYPGRTNGVVSINGRILSNVVSVAAGRTFSLALKKDGTVVAWGLQARIKDIPKLESENGVVLVDPKTGLPMPSVNPEINPKTGLPMSSESIEINPKTGLPMPPVKAETEHITRVGTLSDETVATRLDEQDPVPLRNVVAIAAASFQSLAVKKDGTVVAWDSNYGQLLTVPGWSNIVAASLSETAFGTRDFALKRDGTVVNWGSRSTQDDATPAAGLSNVVAVAAGNSYTLALTRNGTVTGWGFNSVGQATGVPTTSASYISAARQVSIDGQTLSNIVAITAGHGFSMALKNDGTVIAWGRLANGAYPATVPAGLSNVVAIAEGEDFCLAITTNAAVADKFLQK